MWPRPIPEYDESRWVLKALRETAHQLEAQLSGLREADLRWRSHDGWSLKEIAAHLRDSEEHFVECVELIMRGAPAVPCLDADALVMERDYRGVDVHAVCERFEYMRYRSLSTLWELCPDDWQRTSRHPYLGEVSVLQLARRQSQHDLEHIWVARRIHDELLTSAAPLRS